jgi:hypothetical protein
MVGLKESQMATRLQTVELHANPNLVASREKKKVVLTANLSDLELEQIKDQGGEIQFAVDGARVVAKPRDPRSATWTPARAAGRYRATVSLRVNNRQHTIGKTTIHVVKGMKAIRLEIAPPEAEEGELIRLKVVGGPSPASLKAAKLHYQWLTGFKGAPKRGKSNTVRLNTTGISPGTHSVTVRLADERGTTMVGANGPISGTGSVRIKSSPRRKPK